MTQHSFTPVFFTIPKVVFNRKKKKKKKYRTDDINVINTEPLFKSLLQILSKRILDEI